MRSHNGTSRDSVTRFSNIFCLKDSTWALYEQAKMVSQTVSFSRRYSIAKFENRVSAKSTTTPTRNFSLGKRAFIFLNYCFGLCTQVPFLPDCSFKICESFLNVSMFSLSWLRCHSVRVVNDYADTCPHDQQLHWHGVSIVNDYIDMVSV